MLEGTALWVVIAVAGLGTYLIRLSFLAVFERVDTIPPRLSTALRYVPAAVLAALVVPSVVLGGDGAGVAAVAPLKVAAGIVAALVAWRTESILWTFVVGMVALVALQLLVPL